ncbi:hypothetical protein P8C59_001375 [Phyllachora maydis]|uniref:NECAP PHear domain-containing protein n=1 Tax=Phyllachora maydis TaxID=1825666 RepID=A0AAD9HZ66_9PEZI|nr:hypothetical protein P8C59_001375 [Phyllachora maydis]
MQSTDPATGEPLPPEAIQRVLFIANAVHVYKIPPLASTKGYTAAAWTEDPRRHLATCRLRVIETAVPPPTPPDGPGAGAEDVVKTDVVLEDAASGQLFAAAPYTGPAAVEPALDSSRFFALRVQDPAGRKATLGIGFEDRSEAFDLGVALQEALKALALGGGDAPGPGPGTPSHRAEPAHKGLEPKRDYSLKEGETITVNLSGTKLGGRTLQQRTSSIKRRGRDLGDGQGEAASLSSFVLPPPPSGTSSAAGSSPGAGFSLAPPPSAKATEAQTRLSAQDLGFDDGQFGEFA